MNYESHSQAKTELGEILSRLLDISHQISASTNVKEREEKLLCEKEALDTDSLNVLVMGEFSSGKSTFLNALLGDKIFPSSARPCTGCISEIQYGDDWAFTLVPKDETQEPFRIPREQLKEYITIDHNDSKLNPYEKLIVQAPMPLCKHGVKLFDSPGLNDPTSHDKTTLCYMPQADATIYCMDSGHANSKSDGTTLELMKQCGHDAIIFAVTHIDQIDEDEVDDVYDYLRRELETRTSLGRKGIFFLNSKGALKAKIEGNNSMLEESRLPLFEEALEKILAGEKGRIKLGKIHGNVAQINTKYISQLRSMLQTRQTERKTLETKLASVAAPLEQAKTSAERIRRKTRESVAEITDAAMNMANQYYLSLHGKISYWVDDTNFTSPEDLQEYMDNKLPDDLKIDMAEWFNSQVVTMMKDKIAASQRHLGDEIKIFENSLSVISGVECEDFFDEATLVKIGVAALGIVTAVVFGLPTVLLVGLCSMFGNKIVEFIDSLFRERKLNNLKDKIKSGLPDQLKKNKENFLTHIQNSVNKVLEEYCEEVDKKLKEMLAHTETIVKDARDSLNRDTSQIEEEAKRYSLLLKECENVAADLQEFKNRYIAAI